VSRIFLEGEKAQVSHSVEVLGGQTGIPKGLKKNRKFQREGGGNDFGIRRAWGRGRTFWNFQRQGGLKCSCRLW